MAVIMVQTRHLADPAAAAGTAAHAALLSTKYLRLKSRIHVHIHMHILLQRQTLQLLICVFQSSTPAWLHMPVLYDF